MPAKKRRPSAEAAEALRNMPPSKFPIVEELRLQMLEMASKPKRKREPREYSLDPVYYVYGLIDPRNRETFYVGKGKGDRAQGHMRPSALSGSQAANVKKCARIQSIMNDGFCVEVVRLAEGLTEREAYRQERKEIRLAKEKNAELTNYSRGRGDITGELIRSWYQINWLLNHSKTKERWATDWAAHVGRPLVEQDYAIYDDTLRGHVEIYTWIKSKMLEKYGALP